MDQNSNTCRHCQRDIKLIDGEWVDPEATGDDSLWRVTCDAHDTITAEHEPTTSQENDMSVRIWIDTTTGTWGQVQHSQGSLVICDVTPGVAEFLDEASDEEIAEYGLNNGQPAEPASDEPALYTKCAECHLFVEFNNEYVTDVTVSPFLHLHRGDEADERLDAAHEAKPSPYRATLATWQVFGPSAMRERFIDPTTGKAYTS